MLYLFAKMSWDYGFFDSDEGAGESSFDGLPGADVAGADVAGAGVAGVTSLALLSVFSLGESALRSSTLS